MSDEHDRRIAELERHVERLYNTTASAGERLAVMENQMATMTAAVKEARADFTVSVANMQRDLKQTMSDQQNAAHRRTALTLTLGLGAITTIVNVAVAILLK